MVPTSSQAFWRQPWCPQTEAVLTRALHALGLDLAELSSQNFDLATGTVGGLPLSECAFWASAGPTWSCLHLPGGTNRSEELGRNLAELTGEPTLLLTEYQQLAWGFVLIHRKDPIQRFLSLSTMWEDTPTPGTVDPLLMSRLLDIPVSRFAPYLKVQSADEVSQQRAHPEDRYILSNPWVRVDFLRSLGISYPAPTSATDGRFCRLIGFNPTKSAAPTIPPEIRIDPENPSPWISN